MTAASDLFATALKGLGMTVQGHTIQQHDGELAGHILRTIIAREPDHADAYLALIKAGDYTSQDVENLYQCRDTLGRRLDRYGLAPADLNVTCDLGIYVSLPVDDAAGIAAMHIGELLGDRRYDQAAAVARQHGAEPRVALAAACLYAATARWFEVIEALNEMAPGTDPYIVAAARLLAARSCHHIGSYTKSDALLSQPVQAEAAITDYLPAAAGLVNLIRALNARSRGDDIAAELFTDAALDPAVRDQAAPYLADPALTSPVITREMIGSREDPWDAATAADPRVLSQRALQEPRALAAAQAATLLDNTIGMAEIKEQASARVQSSIRIGELRKKQGLKNPDRAHHIVVTGAPGVGKTTILRSLVKIYFSMGILDSPDVIEISRSDLVGKYQGWTEDATRQYIEQAKKKRCCLFIDEAYQLVVSHDSNDFGKHAINVLLAELENHRSEFVCALAGYPDEMNTFMESNPGLRRRFPTHLKLPSYTDQELLDIADHMAAEHDYRFADESTTIMKATITNLISMHRPYREGDTKTRPLIDHVGNAGFIRNVLEASIGEHNRRVDAEMHSGAQPDLTRLTGHDVHRAITKLLTQHYSDAIPPPS